MFASHFNVPAVNWSTGSNNIAIYFMKGPIIVYLFILTIIMMMMMML